MSTGGISGEVRLKIYGERNVGTNYVEALIAQNLRVSVLPGRVPSSDLRTQLMGQLKRVLPGVEAWHEAARDRYFDQHFNRDLGWKHMCPAPERIGASGLAEVRFVIVVKNPYSWLLSLFRSPYHVGGRDADFETFLHRRLPVMETRENIGARALTPVEVWNRKGQGYLALQAAAARAIIVPYEDFLRDEAAIIARIADRLEIARRPDFQSIASGVKRSNRSITREEYVDYYLNERWKADLSAENIRNINSLLDPALMAALHYDFLPAG